MAFFSRIFCFFLCFSLLVADEEEEHKHPWKDDPDTEEPIILEGDSDEAEDAKKTSSQEKLNPTPLLYRTQAPVKEPYGEDPTTQKSRSSRKPKSPTSSQKKKWYIESAFGYFYFTDSNMRSFFNDGGFIFRFESGYRFYNPLTLWMDGSYFEKKGSAIGGTEKLKVRIANMTIGLKALFDLHPTTSVYLGLGPRLFIMLLHNDCAFVRNEDNQVGIGGGFDAGFRFHLIPSYRDFYIDLLFDYSWKTLDIEEDPNCSFNYDIDVSGLSSTLGIGIRF